MFQMFATFWTLSLNFLIYLDHILSVKAALLFVDWTTLDLGYIEVNSQTVFPD